MTDAATTPSAAEAELEWDRLRSYLRAEAAPLALIEVESEAHAAEVVVKIRQEPAIDPVDVYEPPTEGRKDRRELLEWVLEHRASKKILLLKGLHRFAPSDEERQQFWGWVDAQRERWHPDAGKLAFLLTPREVDDLCRCAGSLWDWIPLKFNLLGFGRTGFSAPAGTLSLPVAVGDPDAGEAVKLLPALREQLFQARRQGLPESVIRRRYAWPLFRALVRAHCLREAQAVLEQDLAGDLDSLPRSAAREREELAEMWKAAGLGPLPKIEDEADDEKEPPSPKEM